MPVAGAGEFSGFFPHKRTGNDPGDVVGLYQPVGDFAQLIQTLQTKGPLMGRNLQH